jgi:hypothetical protein
MIQLLRLARNDLAAHLLRSRLAWMGAGTVVLISAIWPQGLAIAGTSRDFTGFSFLRTVAATACETVIPLFVVLVAAGLVAPARANGTLRVVLTGPVRRRDVLAAKLLTALAYMGLLVALHLASAAVVGVRHYEFRGYEEFGEEVVSRGDAIRFFAVGYALTLLPLAATAAYGLAVSVFVRGPVAAMGLAAGGLILLTVLQPFLVFGDVRASDWLWLAQTLVPLQRAEDLSSALASGWWSPAIRTMLATSVAAFVIFLVPSFVIFARRDVAGS